VGFCFVFCFILLINHPFTALESFPSLLLSVSWQDQQLHSHHLIK